MLRPGKGAVEKRSVLGVNKEVEVEMVRDDRCGRGSRHEWKEVSCRGDYSECRSLYSFSNSAA
jgi:hypothetical protein